MTVRFLSLCLLAAALAGCTTTRNPLSQGQVGSLRLAAVAVNANDATVLWWGDGDRAFARAKGMPETSSEELSKTPEARAFIAKAVSAKISSRFEQALRPMLTGHRPVKVSVTVRRLHVASIIQRIVVGGHHELAADVTLVDARTGAPIVSHPNFTVTALAGQGIGGTLIDAAFMAEPIDRLVQNFATGYRDWLLSGGP